MKGHSVVWSFSGCVVQAAFTMPVNRLATAKQVMIVGMCKLSLQRRGFTSGYSCESIVALPSVLGLLYKESSKLGFIVQE